MDRPNRAGARAAPRALLSEPSHAKHSTLPRVPVHGTLDVDVGHTPCRALDFSTLGIRVDSAEELPEGSVHPLRLRGAESVPLLGRVVWCTPTETEVQAGIEFVELTATDRVWLREWVEALQG